MCITFGESLAVIVTLAVTSSALLYAAYAVHMRDVKIAQLERAMRLGLD